MGFFSRFRTAPAPREATSPKETPMSNDAISETIQREVTATPVVLFMKGNPLFPQCGFSATAVAILNHLGVEFKGVDVLADPDIRDGIKAYSDWPTIPQLYVKGEFVGGCDIMREMFEAGELQQHLKDQGIETSPST